MNTKCQIKYILMIIHFFGCAEKSMAFDSYRKYDSKGYIYIYNQHACYGKKIVICNSWISEINGQDTIERELDHDEDDRIYAFTSKIKMNLIRDTAAREDKDRKRQTKRLWVRQFKENLRKCHRAFADEADLYIKISNITYIFSEINKWTYKKDSKKGLQTLELVDKDEELRRRMSRWPILTEANQNKRSFILKYEIAAEKIKECDNINVNRRNK